jgi:hypothetical protein
VLVLSIGCQGFPSKSTNQPGNARVQFSPTRRKHNPSPSQSVSTPPAAEVAASANTLSPLDDVDRALWRLDGFGSPADDSDRLTEPRPASPGGIERSSHALPVQQQITERTQTPPRVESAGPAMPESPPPGLLPQQTVEHGSRGSEADFTANHPIVDSQTQAQRNIADIDGAFAHREGSLFDDIRSRITRRSRRPQAAPRSSPPAEGPFYEHPTASVDGGEPTSSPVISIGVEADSRNPRDGVPLEAPAPLSAVTRQTVLVEKLGELPSEDTEQGPSSPEDDSAAENEGADGFVSSLFDKNSLFEKFGLGADRTKDREANAEIVLRQSQLAELERPLADDDLNDRPASEEALLTPLQTVQWQEDYDRLTTLLETQLASQTPGESPLEQDHYIRQHVALRLLYLIGSRRAEALQAIPGCDRSQQEFWTAMLWALSNIFDEEAMPDRSHRAREAATQLRVALEQITPLAGLKLAKCQFCRQIDGFGSYETFERDEFVPGQSVLIYAEIQNFLSEMTPQGEYLTVLQSTIAIHEQSAGHRVVFHEQLPPTEDRCRSRRSDYYHNYRIRLPQDLKPGRHVLSLTVRDQLSEKQDTVSLSLLVRPDPAK